jgi:hypothetical protein
MQQEASSNTTIVPPSPLSQLVEEDHKTSPKIAKRLQTKPKFIINVVASEEERERLVGRKVEFQVVERTYRGKILKANTRDAEISFKDQGKEVICLLTYTQFRLFEESDDEEKARKTQLKKRKVRQSETQSDQKKKSIGPAEACDIKATQLAQLELSNEEKQKCTMCKLGKISLTVEKVGSTKEPEICMMDCSECKGTGFVDQSQAFWNLVYKKVWCQCPIPDEIFHARDGGKTFGNDTYLCGTCGMVVQFG